MRYGLASSLETSFRRRSAAFHSYVDSLLARNPDAPPEFKGALRKIRIYAKYLPKQLDKELDRRLTGEERYHMISALMEDLRSKMQETDSRFARGGQSDLPRSLVSILDHEIL